MASRLERFRPIAERIDFWAATEASACDGDDLTLSAAHYAEFLFSPRSETMRRYRDA